MPAHSSDPISSTHGLAATDAQALAASARALFERLREQISRVYFGQTEVVELEAMHEGQVMVLATQNPVEQEGTYLLSEAQLDRFLVKVVVRYPTAAEMDGILLRTTGTTTPSAVAEFSADDILSARRIKREVPAAGQVRQYAVRIVLATQPDQPTAPEAVKRHVASGPARRPRKPCCCWPRRGR